MSHLAKPSYHCLDLGKAPPAFVATFSQETLGWVAEVALGELAPSTVAVGASATTPAAESVESAASTLSSAQRAAFDALAARASYVVDTSSNRIELRDGMHGALKDVRRPPLTPGVFARQVMAMAFTNGSDVEAVISLQRKVATIVLGGVWADWTHRSMMLLAIRC